MFNPLMGQKRSGNIFHIVPFEGQEFLDPVAVIALQFDRVPFDRTATGKFSFHKFREIFKIDIGWIKAFDNGYFLTIPAFVHFDIDPLLFFCYLLADT